ncbi:MAG TPA: hypothetical protein GX714_15965 [Chloroflexi bacterium]|jgi:hypothetical protein|nr:hypothetical protein [Chloroflexota bacterium]
MVTDTPPGGARCAVPALAQPISLGIFVCTSSAAAAFFSFSDHRRALFQLLIFIKDSNGSAVALGLCNLFACRLTGDQPCEAALLVASIITTPPCPALFSAAHNDSPRGS